MNLTNKGVFLIIIGIVVIVCLISSIPKNKSSFNSCTVDNNAINKAQNFDSIQKTKEYQDYKKSVNSAPESLPTVKKSEYKDRLNDIQYKIDNNTIVGNPFSLEDIITKATELENIQILMLNASSSSNEEDATKGRKLKSIFLKKLPQYYKVLRKQYADAFAKKLWRENYNIYTEGFGNSTLVLVSSAYSSNANIEDDSNNLLDHAMLLRYKRLKFKWYEGQDDYISYRIKSKSDSKFAGE